MLTRCVLFTFITIFSLPACETNVKPTTEYSNTTMLQAEVSRFLETFRTALEARDFATLETLLAEDFSYREPGSPVLSKSGLLARERRGASGGPVSEIEYDVLSASEANGVITSDVELQFETRLPKAGETILFNGVISQSLTAVRTPDGLLFRSVDVKSQRLFRNGEPVGAEAIEEMHAGDSGGN